jgi:hypothetical protein
MDSFVLVLGVDPIDLRRDNFNLEDISWDEVPTTPSVLLYSTMGGFGTLDIDLGQL